ncbi:MAG: hypothetical protein HDS21_08755 [Bacteroides sp.]|nr:hypothetical protein [Bacteroides sp.]
MVHLIFWNPDDCLRELIPTIPEGLMVNPRANELTPQTLDFWKILNASRS